MQGRQQPIVGRELPDMGTRGSELLQHSLLGGHMDFDIHMRGLDTLMAKPQRNYADVDAGLEQVCTGRVSYSISQ